MADDKNQDEEELVNYSEDEDAGAYPYDLPPERPSAMTPKLSSSGIGGVARLSGDGGSCGGLLLSMLLLLLTPLARAVRRATLPRR